MSASPNPLKPIVVATYNIHKAVGTDGRFDPARIAAVMGELDADVIALQEVDKRRGSRDGVLDLKRIEAETGHRLIPVAIHPESHGFRGNAIFHRAGVVRSVRGLALPAEGRGKAIFTDMRGAVIAELDFGGFPLRIIATHLGLLRRWRNRQVTAIAEALHLADMPTVLMGDTNEWRPGRGACPILALEPFFENLTPPLRSFPSRLPIFPLDRILARPHDAVQSISVHHSALARRASDHLPVRAVIQLVPAHTHQG